MTKYLNFIWKNILAIATCVGLVGGVLSLVSLFAPDNWLDDHKVLIGTHAFYWILLLFGIFLYIQKPIETELALPSVKFIRDNKILLTENANWLSVGTMVAVYLKEDEFEIRKSTGKVINIQQNDLVQIELSDTDQTITTELKENRQNILIKPGVVQ